MIYDVSAVKRKYLLVALIFFYLSLLRKRRCQLLDEIHDKQQSLDEIDYMIEKIRKEL